MPGKRNIVVWYVVSIVTLGLAWLVWYYKVNKDAKTIANNKGWSPAMSVVAVTLGGFIIVPPFVSTWRTWSRVRGATQADGMIAGTQFCPRFTPTARIPYLRNPQHKHTGVPDA